MPAELKTRSLPTWPRGTWISPDNRSRGRGRGGRFSGVVVTARNSDKETLNQMIQLGARVERGRDRGGEGVHGS